MKTLAALLIGASTAVISILLHQTLPPFGVAVSLLFTYCALWSVGRKFGGRTFKWIACIAWFVVIVRASTFGAGEELLVQGDASGSALLLVGTLAALAAVAARS